MRLGWPRLKTNGIGKSKIIIALIAILVVGLLAGWKIYDNSKEAKPNKPLTLQDQNSAASTYASNGLAKKNYDAAVQGCIAASATAFYQQDYSGSKASLEECTAKVPDASVPWYLYSTLAVTADKLNDKALEKDSLQKAIVKASKPDSGVSPATVATLTNKLQSLK